MRNAAPATARPQPASLPVEQSVLERLADLVAGLGANVQPGQIVELRANLEQLELVHALAAAAYRRGARFVDATYFDPAVRRVRLLHAAPETLDFVPSWHRERIRALGEQRCARIALTPLSPPGAFDDVDPARVAREPFPSLPEYLAIVNEGTTNWTAAPGPTASWATRVHPALPPADALALLWEQVVHVLRLDEPDPVEAWRRRFASLRQVTARLNERGFDALHFTGPGTDLTLGLLPTSRWETATSETVDGIEHAPNLPTEETFTAPDPERVDGVASATKPLVLKGGVLVERLVVRFERGRAVQVEAASGAEALRELLASDEGASRLGEVALVDGDTRVGALDTVFYATLLDENAAAHLALGSAYPDSVAPEDRSRANRSAIHVDFMVGGDAVDVTASERDGRRVPLLRGGAWQI